MTTKTHHVVVDGSNIATEGRSLPSLAQLNEAVLAFMAEFPDATVTVVVDATFGHRIDKSEVDEFDSAVANNELVAPPAGAVGRGDAFVLGIANKAGATILSNDSFQEFHGDYPWLFDDGRLIGGKPVPNVGWVFVERTPVRGAISRKAVRGSKNGDAKRSGGRAKRARSATASKEASQPMPVPSSPPPGLTPDAEPSAEERPKRRARKKAAPAPDPVEATAAAPSEASGSTGPTGASEPSSSSDTSGPPTSRDMVNELMPFLEFVEHHPVGTSVNAVVDSYASHGAYVRIGDALAYVPLRLMADPPPRSARQVMKVDDAVTLVVAAFAPSRRSIDCAMPHMATDLVPQDTAEVIEQTPRVADDAPAASVGHPPGKRSAPTEEPVAETAAAAKKAPAKKAAAKRTAAKKAAADTSAAKKAPARTTAAKRAPAENLPAETAPAGKVLTERPAPRKAAGKKAAAAEEPAAENAPAKKAAAKKAAAKKAAAADKAPAEKAPAKKAVAGKAVAGKAVAEKAPAKKAAAKKAPAKKAAAKKAPAKKAAAKKAPAKKAPAKKAAAKKAPAKKVAAKKAPAGSRRAGEGDRHN